MRQKEAKRLESEDSANVEVVRLTAIVESVKIAEPVEPFVLLLIKVIVTYYAPEII